MELYTNVPHNFIFKNRFKSVIPTLKYMESDKLTKFEENYYIPERISYIIPYGIKKYRMLIINRYIRKLLVTNKITFKPCNESVVELSESDFINVLDMAYRNNISIISNKDIFPRIEKVHLTLDSNQKVTIRINCADIKNTYNNQFSPVMVNYSTIKWKNKGRKRDIVLKRDLGLLLSEGFKNIILLLHNTVIVYHIDKQVYYRSPEDNLHTIFNREQIYVTLQNNGGYICNLPPGNTWIPQRISKNLPINTKIFTNDSLFIIQSQKQAKILYKILFLNFMLYTSHNVYMTFNKSTQKFIKIKNPKQLSMNFGYEFETGTDTIKYSKDIISKNCRDGGGIESISKIVKNTNMYLVFSMFNEFCKNIRNNPKWYVKHGASTHFHFSFLQNDLREVDINLLWHNIHYTFQKAYLALTFFDSLCPSGRRNTVYGFGLKRGKKYFTDDLWCFDAYQNNIPNLGRGSLLRIISFTPRSAHLEWRGMDSCMSSVAIGLKTEFIKALCSYAYSATLNHINFKKIDQNYIHLGVTMIQDLQKTKSVFGMYDIICRSHANTWVNNLSEYLPRDAICGLKSWIRHISVANESNITGDFFKEMDRILISDIGYTKFVTNKDICKLLKDRKVGKTKLDICNLFNVQKHNLISTEALKETHSSYNIFEPLHHDECISCGCRANTSLYYGKYLCSYCQIVENTIKHQKNIKKKRIPESRITKLNKIVT